MVYGVGYNENTFVEFQRPVDDSQCALADDDTTARREEVIIDIEEPAHEEEAPAIHVQEGATADKDKEEFVCDEEAADTSVIADIEDRESTGDDDVNDITGELPCYVI